MKRTLLISMFVGLIWHISPIASAGYAASTGPRLKADAEAFDFGLVPQHAIVSHTYWLKNTGTETVVIEQLRPNCGCTEAPLTDSIVAVGDSVPVEIQFGSGRSLGKIEKYIRVISNAQGRVPALIVRAYVVADSARVIETVPVAIQIDSAESGKQDFSFTVRNRISRALNLRAVDTGAAINLSHNELKLASKGDARVTGSVSIKKDSAFKQSITWTAVEDSTVRFTIPISNRHAP